MATAESMKHIQASLTRLNDTYNRILSDMIVIAKRNEFPTECQISHPYSFETFMALNEEATILSDIFRQIQRTHGVLMHYFQMTE